MGKGQGCGPLVSFSCVRCFKDIYYIPRAVMGGGHDPADIRCLVEKNW